MLADPSVAGAGRATSPASGCSCATCGASTARQGRVPGLRRQPAAGVPARDRAVRSTASCARTAASLELLTADYTFVNERLASHYGIPNVYGSQFRRVTLVDEARRGLLGKGSILMVTSHADRTSPVVRGKWILDNLLGTPPPPPPADVPPLEESDGRKRRARCASGWSSTAPTRPARAATSSWIRSGFALENFDAVGAWRTTRRRRADRRHRVSSRTARRSTARHRCGEALLQTPRGVRRTSPRSC